MKKVSFSHHSPIHHTLPAMLQQEYSMTFYNKAEIERFRHEAVLEMTGVASSEDVTSSPSRLHRRKSARSRKRASVGFAGQSTAEILSVLRASSLYKATEQEEHQNENGTFQRPPMGDRQPSIRQRRESIRLKKGSIQQKRGSVRPQRGSVLVSVLPEQIAGI